MRTALCWAVEVLGTQVYSVILHSHNCLVVWQPPVVADYLHW